jgi:hypothetical protein
MVGRAIKKGMSAECECVVGGTSAWVICFKLKAASPGGCLQALAKAVGREATGVNEGLPLTEAVPSTRLLACPLVGAASSQADNASSVGPRSIGKELANEAGRFLLVILTFLESGSVVGLRTIANKSAATGLAAAGSSCKGVAGWSSCCAQT